MIKNKVIIIGGDNYNTCGMIRTLGEKKIDFDCIIIKNDNGLVIASKSKFLNGKHVEIVDSIQEGYKILLKKQISKLKTFLLVEGDQLTGFLDMHYDSLKEKYIWNTAYEQGRLSKYLNKYEQVEVAKKCGIRVLESHVIDRYTIPDDLEYPVITKAISSEVAQWKSECYICNSKDELQSVFSKIKSSKIMVQKYIKKSNELCFDGFSINKEKSQFISILSKYNYLLSDKYSYYLTVENVNDEKYIKEITDFMTYIQYDGIYAFEYIVDEDGNSYFMENNFRNSGWSYASTCAGMPLPILWMESMVTGKIDYSKIKEIKKGFTFVDDFADFQTRVCGRMISFSAWLKEYKNCDCRLLLGRNDPYPLIAYVISRLFNKIERKVLRKKPN